MRLFALLILLALLVAAPTAAQDTGDESITPEFAYTYHRPDGNRIVAGAGSFPGATNIETGAVYANLNWVWGAVVNGQPLLVSYQADGSVGLSHRNESGQPADLVVEAIVNPGGGNVPMIVNRAGRVSLYAAATVAASPATHPIPIGEDWLYIAQDGSLNLLTSEDEAAEEESTPVMPLPLMLNALPDARLVVNDAGQVALYSGATDSRYVHNVLGDALEGAALSVVEVRDDSLELVQQVELPGTEVFEGIAPFWADVNQDGSPDLVTTVSDFGVGAQLRVYNLDGSVLAQSDPIGQGNRWRHQLAFGAFGVDGALELVDVRTPHIGGIVEFFRLNGDRLEIVASTTGYTSHIIGSRNLDMAVAGDFNGDGQLEIVMPDQSRTRIAGLQRTADGVAEVWSLPLDGRAVTNLAAVALPDGRLVLAVGTDAGNVSAWVSR